MPFRKITATRIFDGYRFRTGHALIFNEKGYIEALVPLEEAGADAEVLEGIITPGFINCHCHLELSHMKGLIREGTGLIDFVLQVISSRHYSEDAIKEAIGKAEREMQQAGIVAVGDICNTALTIDQKKKGTLSYYNFIEAFGWLPAVAAARFQHIYGIYQQFEKNDRWTMTDDNKNSGIQGRSSAISHLSFASIVPHAPYSVSNPLWQAIRPHFKAKTVSIHNQEAPFEDEFFIQGTGAFPAMYSRMNMDNSHHIPTGKSSLQSYFHQLAEASKVILVHNTFTTEADIRFVQQASVNYGLTTFFCLCANANIYIEKALPPVELLHKNKGTMVLGTDSLASNHSLSIADEMKTILRHFPSLPLEEILQWATLNGARALNMDTFLGSFEKGKRPGINLLNEKDFSVQPLL